MSEAQQGPKPDWGEAVRKLKLQAGGPAHDTPVGACWYCRRMIDNDPEAWKFWPAAERMVHLDRLKRGAAPSRVVRSVFSTRHQDG